MTLLASTRARGLRRKTGVVGRPTGLPWLIAVEVFSGLVGFGVALHFAHRLGKSGFSHVEYASAVAAWLLVLVRGGVENIVHREAARKPRLIHRLTEVLLGLKFAAAILGNGIVLIAAALVGAERGTIVAVAGLLLFPSAMAADVFPRASGRLGGLVVAQSVRALGLAASAWFLVYGQVHAERAAWCAIVAETASALALLHLHARQYGIPIPRFGRRTMIVFARRGLIASLIRFGRVSVMGADLLALGWLAGEELAPYAAARRVVFAIAAVGLIVPAAVAPLIARAWLIDRREARRLLSGSLAGLMAVVLPATIGLMMTAERWTTVLFGGAYNVRGSYLVLVACRLPFLISASSFLAVLVACRREAEAVRLTFWTSASTLLTMAFLAVWAGPWGVGLAALLIDVLGTAAGWRSLGRLGMQPFEDSRWRRIALGCVALIFACRAAESLPIVVVCLTGAAAYGGVYFGCGRRNRLRRQAPC